MSLAFRFARRARKSARETPFRALPANRVAGRRKRPMEFLLPFCQIRKTQPKVARSFAAGTHPRLYSCGIQGFFAFFERLRKLRAEIAAAKRRASEIAAAGGGELPAAFLRLDAGVPVAENFGVGTGFPRFTEIYLQTYTPRARGRVPVRPAAGVPARHVRPQSSIKRISRFRQRGGRSRVAGRKCVLAGAVVCVGCVGKIFNLRGNLQAAIPLFIYHSFPFL